jgi:hypothetical protein
MSAKDDRGDVAENYFEVHRAWVAKARADIDEQLAVCLATESPESFQELQRQVHQFNVRLNWLHEREQDELDRLLSEAHQNAQCFV